jgi:hypothetical protein
MERNRMLAGGFVVWAETEAVAHRANPNKVRMRISQHHAPVKAAGQSSLGRRIANFIPW